MSDQFELDTLASLARIEALADAADEAWPALTDEEAARHDDALEQDWLASDESQRVERSNMLDRLAQVVNACNELADETKSPGGCLELAQGLKSAEEELREARRDLENRAVMEFPVGTVIGDAEIVWDKRWTKVQWSQLMPRTIAALVDTPGVMWAEDGERLPGAVAAANLVDALHRCVGWSSAKRPGLAELGIDLDEYAERRAAQVIRWKKAE
jgi:hypothetical protein